MAGSQRLVFSGFPQRLTWRSLPTDLSDSGRSSPMKLNASQSWATAFDRSPGAEKAPGAVAHRGGRYVLIWTG